MNVLELFTFRCIILHGRVHSFMNVMINEARRSSRPVQFVCMCPTVHLGTRVLLCVALETRTETVMVSGYFVCACVRDLLSKSAFTKMHIKGTNVNADSNVGNPLDAVDCECIFCMLSGVRESVLGPIPPYLWVGSDMLTVRVMLSV